MLNRIRGTWLAEILKVVFFGLTVLGIMLQNAPVLGAFIFFGFGGLFIWSVYKL